MIINTANCQIVNSPSFSGLAQPRKLFLKQEVKKFNKRFPSNWRNGFPAERNICGQLLHLSILMAYIDPFLIKAFASHNFPEIAACLFGAKWNLDFIPKIRNINKRKAALLSSHLKRMAINNPEELRYAISQHFIRNGMPLYPITHSRGMSKIAEQSDYNRTFETALFTNRTDKKNLLQRFMI